jgi:hypothetical protein
MSGVELAHIKLLRRRAPLSLPQVSFMQNRGTCAAGMPTRSCAVIEAEERGLADVLRREIGEPLWPLADALTFCDMTTSPDGDQVHVNPCLAEIHDLWVPKTYATRRYS